MLRIYVDFNARELGTDESVAIPLHTTMAEGYRSALATGQRVTVHDEETEAEAVLRPGAQYPWVATLVRDTIRHIDATGSSRQVA